MVSSNKKRYFAFGCSYVNYGWATLSDLIAANFDEYYNYGVPGGCNTLSLSNLIEANEFYNFNSETDYITVGITGFGRFSILNADSNNKFWITSGETMPFDSNCRIEDWAPNHNPKSKLFAEHLDSYTWHVQRTYVAVEAIKNILENYQLEHSIYPSLDNLLYKAEFQNNRNSKYNISKSIHKMVDKIYSRFTIKESIDQFILDRGQKAGFTYDDNAYDTHPTQTQYYEYLKKYFTKFDTKKTKDRFEYVEKIFCKESGSKQRDIFSEQFHKNYRTQINQTWIY